MKYSFLMVAWQALVLLGFVHSLALAQQTPYRGQPIQLPGVIQTEDFDHGGEGIAFHVAVPAIPSEANYRYTVVPLYPTTDISGGYEVRLAPGDWLEYTVEIIEPGLFELRARVWHPLTRPIFELSVDGKDLTGGLAVYPGWEPAWQTVSQQPVVLTAGTHTLRLTMKEIWYYDYSGPGDGLADAQPTDGITTSVNWIELRPVASLRPAEYLAGTDVPGFADGPGLLAQFSGNVTGMDVDVQGNVYLADAGNSRIRKVTPVGEVSTLAGDGIQGWVDGPGSTARFYDLTAWGNSLVVDDSGVVYVLDRPPGTNAVRRISSDGTVSTYYQVKQGPATYGAPSTFQDIAVGHAMDDLLLVHYQLGLMSFSTTCLRLDASRTVSSVFSTGGTGSGGTYIRDLSTDRNGNYLYSAFDYTFGDASQIWWRTALGGDTLLFSSSNGGYGEWGSNAAVDSAGDVYFIADLVLWSDIARGLSILRLKPTENPTLVHRHPTLGKLALKEDGTIYAMEGTRLIRLAESPGYALALITDEGDVDRQPDGGGTAIANPPGPLYLPGTAVHVTAQPSEGWTFLSWEGDRSETTPALDVIMTNHLTIKPLFVTTVQTPVTNGSVLREPDLEVYRYRQRVKLTAQPDEGFEFVKWSDGFTNAAREFNVNDPVTLSPVFSALPRYTVTASVLGGVGGSVIARPGGPEYFRDTVVRVSARPVPGYVFQVWLDGNTTNPRTISVQSNTTLFAVFAPGQGAPPQLTLTPPASVVKGAGSSLTLSATAEGSTPLDCQWYHNDAALPDATSFELTLTNLQADAEGIYRLVVDNGLGTATAESEVTVLPTTRLEAMTWDAWLRFQINLSGEKDRSFRIYSSPDLEDWTLLTTVTNLSGNTVIVDPTENALPALFYMAEPLEIP
jgi:hypothetical protein